MTAQTWVITGCSRGLGLEFVRQLSRSSTNTVFATCRNPTSAIELQALAAANVHILPLDIENWESIKAAAAEISSRTQVIDVLINNAGQNIRDTVLDIDPDNLLDHMRAHVAGPALLVNSLLPLLERSPRPRVINMTSGLGSISAGVRSRPDATYAIAKAAQNMLTCKFAAAKPNVIFVAMAPGWVKTEMGGPHAPLTPEESIGAVLHVTDGLTLEQSGQFLKHDGGSLPW